MLVVSLLTIVDHQLALSVVTKPIELNIFKYFTMVVSGLNDLLTRQPRSAIELKKQKQKHKPIIRAAVPVWMSVSLYETGHSQLQFINFIKRQHRGTSLSNPVLNSIDTNRKMMAYDESVV